MTCNYKTSLLIITIAKAFISIVGGVLFYVTFNDSHCKSAQLLPELFGQLLNFDCVRVLIDDGWSSRLPRPLKKKVKHTGRFLPIPPFVFPDHLNFKSGADKCQLVIGRADINHVRFSKDRQLTKRQKPLRFLQRLVMIPRNSLRI